MRVRHSSFVLTISVLFLGEQMAQVQATCDIALAADSDRLLATASRLARDWLANGSPDEEIENEIEKLLTALEKRTYPSRWIVDFKSSEPAIDGIVADGAD